MTIYTYDAWVEKFQPMPNHLRNQDNGLELAYETYGDEVEYVNLQDEKFVWTEVDGDDGTYILAGWHFVNRIQYYITNRPWDDEFSEVPTWIYRECDNAEEGECNAQCPECNGESTIIIPTETVEDLKKIYGEATNIVG